MINGEVLHESSQHSQQNLLYQSTRNFQFSSQPIEHNQAKQNSNASLISSSNSRDSQQSSNGIESQQEPQHDQIQHNIKQQIWELKNMAILLKQKLYKEKKSDFDQSIIEYSQQQKKIFQEKSELDKISNIQKTFSFNNQLDKTHSNTASPIDVPQNFARIVEESSINLQESQDQGHQAAPLLHENQSDTSSEQADSPKDMQIEKLSSQNLLLENQNKRLAERIDQLNSTIEKQLEEFDTIKSKCEVTLNLLSTCCFAQSHLYQLVQSAQVQIDSSTGCLGYVTIQGNKIIIYEDIYDHKTSLDKIFFIYELQSIDYQKVTMKLNFEKSESLRQFDSLIYIQRMKKKITERKPFFNHPELPKAEGVIGRVIKIQQNKSLSPQRPYLYTPDLNTSNISH